MWWIFLALGIVGWILLGPVVQHVIGLTDVGRLLSASSFLLILIVAGRGVVVLVRRVLGRR